MRATRYGRPLPTGGTIGVPAPWYVDGYLTQLGHAGKLASDAGVVVGDMEKCDWHEGRRPSTRTPGR